jgi:hypothetical protein
VSCIAFDARRMPSTIDACTSRSEIITSSGPRMASKTPAFASRQLGKRIVSSVPRNSVSFCSSVRCRSCVPQMNRTLDMPYPRSSRALCAAAMTSGWLESPR